MPSPKSILGKSGLHAKKQLGQNFLSDPSTAEMIVSQSGICKSDTVLEIGPGLGALTLPLARIAKHVIAVEKDPQIAGILKTLLAENNHHVTVIENDILQIDINALAAQARQKLIVVGNLPYHISSQVLIQLIHNRDSISHAVLMFQKELADRITAEPGIKD
jgi:16S rRNA (adenine1518-N6/adenine1519-N6)-dimethyltransferase